MSTAPKRTLAEVDADLLALKDEEVQLRAKRYRLDEEAKAALAARRAAVLAPLGLDPTLTNLLLCSFPSIPTLEDVAAGLLRWRGQALTSPAAPERYVVRTEVEVDEDTTRWVRTHYSDGTTTLDIT
jgi:hypothetical protein